MLHEVWYRWSVIIVCSGNMRFWFEGRTFTCRCLVFPYVTHLYRPPKAYTNGICCERATCMWEMARYFRKPKKNKENFHLGEYHTFAKNINAACRERTYSILRTNFVHNGPNRMEIKEHTRSRNIFILNRYILEGLKWWYYGCCCVLSCSFPRIVRRNFLEWEQTINDVKWQRYRRIC